MKWILKLPKRENKFIVYKATCTCGCEFLLLDNDIHTRIKSINSDIVGYCDCADSGINGNCKNKKVPIYRKDILTFDSKEEFDKYISTVRTEYVEVDNTKEKELKELIDKSRKDMLEAVLPKTMAEDIITNCILSESEFVEVVVGKIYNFAPMHKPRKVDKIVEHIHKYFVEHKPNKFFIGQLVVKNDKKEIASLVNSILLSCDEFVELNLSQKEYEANISPNDPNRQKFTFVGAFIQPSPMDDFIDLDAITMEITNEIYTRINH